MAQMIL
jgi:hypothetical protein